MTNGGTKVESHILVVVTLPFFLVFSVAMFDFLRDFFGELAAEYVISLGNQFIVSVS